MFEGLRFAGNLAADVLEALLFRPLGNPQHDSRWPHGRDWDDIPDAEFAREVLADDEPDDEAATGLGDTDAVTYRDRTSTDGPLIRDSDRLDKIAALLEDIRNVLNHGGGPAPGCAPTPGAGTLDVNILDAAHRGLRMWLCNTTPPQGRTGGDYWQSIVTGLAQAANDIRAARDAVAPK